MFDNMERLLRKLGDSVAVPIPMPIDDDRYLDRRCAATKCKADFKVLIDDWKSKVDDDAAYCPICRNEAPASNWNTKAQRKFIRDHARAYIQKQFGQAMQRDADAFNRSQRRGGFISMSMTYKPGPTQTVVPYKVADAMRQKFECEVCGCRYSSIGAAFFCPACGHNSASTTFDASIEAVRATIAQIPAIKEAVSDPDIAQNTTRLILEQSFDKLVSAFQRFAEATFSTLPNASQFKPRKNVFQNLYDSSDLWRTATGTGYDNLIAVAELDELLRFFQQRHLIAHKEGIVDQDYINKSGDSSYALGQRLVVRDAAVLRLADILSKLASELRVLISGLPE